MVSIMAALCFSALRPEDRGGGGRQPLQVLCAESTRGCVHRTPDLQRDGDGDPDQRTWLRDETGGLVSLRLTTQPLEQLRQRADDDCRHDAVDGAYRLRRPGPKCSITIARQGAVADEAIAAAGIAGEQRRDIGVLAVTSADRLNAGWTVAQRERAGAIQRRGRVPKLMASLPSHCTIVTAIEGHPARLSWLGPVAGHQTSHTVSSALARPGRSAI